MFYQVETVLDRLVGRSRFLFVLGLLGGLVGGLSACDADLCETQLLDEVTSPDGTYQAEISERDCGATGASTMLTVHALRETEDGWEQLNIPLSNSQSSAASGEWQSETELVVAIGGGSGGGRRVIDLKQVWADRLVYETGATFPSIEPAFDLTGRWRAEQLDGEPLGVDETVAPWFEITDSTIGGSLGCDDWRGRYRLQGSRLRVADLVATDEPLCEGGDEPSASALIVRSLVEMLLDEGGIGVDVADETMTWSTLEHTVTFVAASD